MTDIPNHDELLDDPLYRREVVLEELATLLDELVADDPCNDDGCGDYD